VDSFRRTAKKVHELSRLKRKVTSLSKELNIYKMTLHKIFHRVDAPAKTSASFSAAVRVN
jgi:hypothetical protein